MDCINQQNNNLEIVKDEEACKFNFEKCEEFADTVMVENQYVDPTTSSCTICGKVMKRRSIEFHTPLCKIGNKDKFRCMINNCGQTFRKLADKTDHAKNAHSYALLKANAKYGKCPACQKYFQMDWLSSHRRRCELRRYRCPLKSCKYTFCSKEGKDKHYKNCHTNPECLIYVNPQFMVCSLDESGEEKEILYSRNDSTSSSDTPPHQDDPLDVGSPIFTQEPVEKFIVHEDGSMVDKSICVHCKIVLPSSILDQHLEYCAELRNKRKNEAVIHESILNGKCDIRTKNAVILLHRIPESTLEFYRQKNASRNTKILLRLNREDENWCLKV